MKHVLRGIKRSLFLWLLFPYAILAQVQTIVLKPERLSVRPNGYYIAEGVDERAVTANVGKIWSRPQPITAVLQGGTAKALEVFLNRAFNPTKTDTLVPIIVVIKELRISETLTPANRVNGEIKLGLNFETYREGKRTALTGANAVSTYTRSGVTPEDVIESMLRKLIENQLKGFNSWFSKGIKTSDVFVREVKLIFEDDLPISDGDTLYYHSERPLVWKDFLGAPSVLSRWAAQIFTSFGFEARSSVSNRVLELRVKTKVWMDKTISWVRQDSKNDYVLDHEQLHFDITRLVSERFRRHLKTMAISSEDFSSEIQYQYIEYYRKHTELQQRYDEETAHGINKPQQAEWAKKVRDELRSYGIKPARP